MVKRREAIAVQRRGRGELGEPRGSTNCHVPVRVKSLPEPHGREAGHPLGQNAGLNLDGFLTDARFREHELGLTGSVAEACG